MRFLSILYHNNKITYIIVTCVLKINKKERALVGTQSFNLLNKYYRS